MNIVLFASGSGSNAENIAHYFKEKSNVQISAILCNNPDAFVLKRAKKLNIPTVVFSREDFYNSNKIINFLTEKNIDLIVLAGFLWLIPHTLIEKYPNRIINIHPALLPKYGGKGMYGNHVHEAVVANGETKTGITIHFVNEQYDEGKIIFQESCEVTPDDTAESVAQKIHELEYKYFPPVIESVIKDIQDN